MGGIIKDRNAYQRMYYRKKNLKLYFREYYKKNSRRILERRKHNRRAELPQSRERRRKRYHKQSRNPKWRAERAAYTKRWREGKGRVKYLARSRDKQLRIKQQVLLRLGKVACEWCGVVDIRVLEVHHLHGDGQRDYRQRGMSSAGLYGAILRGERKIDDLGVLCVLCNRLEYLYRKYLILRNTCKVKWTIPNPLTIRTEMRVRRQWERKPLA